MDDVCVVGMPDTYSGELPLAFVVPSQFAQAQVSNGEGEQAKRGIMEVRPGIMGNQRQTHKTWMIARREEQVSVQASCAGRVYRGRSQDSEREASEKGSPGASEEVGRDKCKALITRRTAIELVLAHQLLASKSSRVSLVVSSMVLYRHSASLSLDIPRSCFAFSALFNCIVFKYPGTTSLSLSLGTD